MTTTAVIDDLCRGSDAAWRVFHERFKRPILALASKLGVPANAADDVAQEVMLTFIQGLREGRYERGKGRLSSWLLGIARMKSLKARENRRALPAEDGLSSLEVDDRSLDEAWERSWASNLLELCLERVRADVDTATFAAFELVTLRGVTPNDAATRLGVSANTVYIAKHRVLKRLRNIKDELESIHA